jgi:hypothetical protein
MKNIFVLLIILTSYLYSQTYNSNNLTGQFFTQEYQNGIIATKIITNPVLYNYDNRETYGKPLPSFYYDNSSNIRWTYGDPASIGTYCTESGNGQHSIVGWYLNNMRTQCFGNTNNNPLWTYQLPNALTYNYVAVSANGSRLADGYYQGIYLLNGDSGTVIYNFNITGLLSTGQSGPVGITRSGDFVIGSVNATTSTDTSFVVGFAGSSPNVIWRFKSPPGTGGSGIQGIKISGNDSLAIINAYLNFWVIQTYTGQVIYSGSVNPSGTSGTQMPQGISGNGNIIATINYNGYVRVYQWSGSTYNFLWQHLEPPGTYYNWMSAVDVTYDGSMVAIGTLNFITSSTYDGKVKLFSVSGGSTPIWKYSGFGDEVNAVTFSRNGRVLSAASWGDYYNPSTNNLLIFKTTHNDSIPLYAVNSTGSFFDCGISDDGTTVIGSGKAVHARYFGSGGIMYNVFIDTAEYLGISGNNNRIPSEYKLEQNFPNPFNPSTQINYDLPKEGFVKLTVFDITGREVQQLINSVQRAGKHSIIFSPENLSSGLYFYKLESSGFTETRKMTLIK